MDGTSDFQNDENTPLLPSKQRRTPLPWLQISILLLLQICEPICSQSIYPYINEVCIIYVTCSEHPADILRNSLWGSLMLLVEMNKKLVIMLGLSLSPFLFCVKMRQVLTGTWCFLVIGIALFCDRGCHRVPMESNIRPYWEKASPLVWDGRNDFIHVILRVV